MTTRAKFLASEKKQLETLLKAKFSIAEAALTLRKPYNTVWDAAQRWSISYKRDTRPRNPYGPRGKNG